ncbi:MAG: 5-formyltetrahydrofolate cyclo-ligase [Tannerella sp.]|jgi:5-formyltetrahydrofolate cyclo-ligase|nr:5-formyltetrahydrofolate cyclo-ligase [Tannerella sp.]
MKTKQEVRKEIAELKKTFAAADYERLSGQVCRRLANTEYFAKAKCVAFYYSTRDEVSTWDFIEEWRVGKRIALPVVVGEDMEFYAYEGPSKMKLGAFGIAEPLGTERIDIAEIDMFVVPGVAFDRNLNRLGRGKGFYDRVLSSVDKPVIGLCFGFQLLDKIPAEVHDRRMTAVVTEDAIVS